MNPLPTAFRFDEVVNGHMDITRLAWTTQARAYLETMRASLRNCPESLPVRDLRLRLQVRDASVLRVDNDLGLGFGSGTSLLVTTTNEHKAAPLADAAVADWVQSAILDLTRVDHEAGKALRKLALDGGAVSARTERVQVFKWDRQRRNGTAKPTTVTQFADLADFVAIQLAGQEVFAGTGPIRRIVSSDLKTGRASLITDPLSLDYEGTKIRFSLGLSVRVATYPGRALPVVIMSHQKHVWSREPRTGGKDITGFAFPKGEARALAFGIKGSDLTLKEEYAAIARQYNLPLGTVNARDLAAQGETPNFQECRVYVTHQPGRAEKDAASRGVTDMDRRLSFERALDILMPLGLTPWAALREIPTHYNQSDDADNGWKHAFTELEREPDEDDQEFQKRSARAEQELTDWVAKTRSGIEAHYGGKYHLTIAYQNGLGNDAQTAAGILGNLLGEHATIHLEAIPDDTHGPRRSLPHSELKPGDRAQARAEAWAPFLKTCRSYMSRQTTNPVRGILVLARKWYPDGIDDQINKRVARITLNRELGLTVQYLLPADRKKDDTISELSARKFRMRVINAWRDCAWKSIGKMHGLEHKFERSLQPSPNKPSEPIVLGLGVIRTNRRRGQQNDTSFIPYAIELDTKTGVCSAALLLKDGDAEPQPTPMLELPQAIKALTQNGPSHLARNVPAKARFETLQQRTQAFMYQIIAERARLHPELIVLADMSTLSGLWTWLADAGVDPTNVELAGNLHVEQDFPYATIARLRDDHAPKVLMDAKRVRVRIDGEIRPAAMWSDANLFALEDVDKAIPTFLSFGSRIIKQVRGTSSYRQMENELGKPILPWLGAWSTPNALEITVIRSPMDPEDIAKLVEALRSEYAHYGSWTKYPAPLFFESFLKEYVPDYELIDEEEEIEVEEDEE